MSKAIYHKYKAGYEELQLLRSQNKILNDTTPNDVSLINKLNHDIINLKSMLNVLLPELNETIRSYEDYVESHKHTLSGNGRQLLAKRHGDLINSLEKKGRAIKKMAETFQ